MADTTATAVRPTAHVITLADRRAAPSITDTTDRDTIALHVQAAADDVGAGHDDAFCHDKSGTGAPGLVGG